MSRRTSSKTRRRTNMSCGHSPRSAARARSSAGYAGRHANGALSTGGDRLRKARVRALPAGQYHACAFDLAQRKKLASPTSVVRRRSFWSAALFSLSRAWCSRERWPQLTSDATDRSDSLRQQPRSGHRISQRPSSTPTATYWPMHALQNGCSSAQELAGRPAPSLEMNGFVNSKQMPHLCVRP